MSKRQIHFLIDEDEGEKLTNAAHDAREHRAEYIRTAIRSRMEGTDYENLIFAAWIRAFKITDTGQDYPNHESMINAMAVAASEWVKTNSGEGGG